MEKCVFIDGGVTSTNRCECLSWEGTTTTTTPPTTTTVPVTTTTTIPCWDVCSNYDHWAGEDNINIEECEDVAANYCYPDGMVYYQTAHCCCWDCIDFEPDCYGLCLALGYNRYYTSSGQMSNSECYAIADEYCWNYGGAYMWDITGPDAECCCYVCENPV